MATVDELPPGNSVERERGLSVALACIACVRAVPLPNDVRRTVSSVRPASLSLGVKKFFISSARSVGEASLTDLPLIMVTLLGVLNTSSTMLLTTSFVEGGCRSCCRRLTAVKPTGGDSETSMLLTGLLLVLLLLAPLTSAGEMGEPSVLVGCLRGSRSCSRLVKIAVRRPFILWIICRARPDTGHG
jgi:hypothetical protein